MTLAGRANALLASIRRRPHLSAALAIFVVVVLGAWTTRDLALTAALLRADPDQIGDRPDLLAFGLPRGRQGYARHCASCHGADGRGDAANGVPNLADSDWLYGSGKVGEIETVILNGVRAPQPKTFKLARMPAYARKLPYPQEPALQPLSPDDIRDVAAYLLVLEGRAVASAASGRGSTIFLGRGGCYDCHGPDGHGDPGVGAPNLADRIWLYGAGSSDAIFDSIAYGRAGVCPAWSGRLKPAPIREIALYVHDLSRHNDRDPRGAL